MSPKPKHHWLEEAGKENPEFQELSLFLLSSHKHVASDNDRLPKNPAGLAKSKTNCSFSHSLCEEPLSWSLGATENPGTFGLYSREAIRQEQKNVCSPFHYNVPQTKKMAQGKEKADILTLLNVGSPTFYHATVVLGEVKSYASKVIIHEG